MNESFSILEKEIDIYEMQYLLIPYKKTVRHRGNE